MAEAKEISDDEADAGCKGEHAGVHTSQVVVV
jgi:hypothetical protein